MITELLKGIAAILVAGVGYPALCAWSARKNERRWANDD